MKNGAQNKVRVQIQMIEYGSGKM